ADVRAAIHAQLDDLAFAHTGFFTSQAAEELADLLIDEAPEGIERVYFGAGGSEAVEAALKLARQYMIEIEQPGRHRKDGESAEDYGLRAANALEEEILRLGPDSVMAFIAEPVVGATAGAVPPVPGYFKRIREICDQYGVLLILDEVMCGMGRTGTFFACEQDGISPDIITIAKGLGAGYAPIGAMLASGKIYDAIVSGSGAFQHGHTYHGHPLATAAGRAVVTAMRERGLVERAKVMGDTLNKALHDEFGQHPHVGDIRGRGLFRALEFVADRESKRPFAPEKKVAGRLKAAAMAEGLIVYPASGTVDGQKGDHCLIAPAFIISEDEIGELVSRLSRAVAATI
ncbi:MAG: aminotransferase class III-fold pyridoxal phosphate-dependent enzyme, partial [Alphaproteobacteria bacterium]|nr:aminotransferase class III-fold pyridoxal phosphate-dependent enzyme [Alphaproteobacteria bacterium]